MSSRFGLNLLKKLLRDEDGSILAYFTVMIPVLFGFVGLVVDAGAFFHLNTDLQELADAAALAGAKELDGSSDAITRATDKAQNLLVNDPHWSNVALAGSQIQSLTFYSSIGPTPAADVATTDPVKATYVKVTTVQRERAPSFLVAVGATAGNTHASALAGSTYIACNVQPLMLCNPKEATNSTFTATAGQLFEFTPTGNTQGFSPGDFGLLDPAGSTHSGAKTIRNLLSQQSPNFCYVNNLSPRPGQATNDVNDGIDARFDIPPNGNSNGMDRTPAPNVIKGEVANNANCKSWQVPSGDVPLPSDTDLTAAGATRIGNTMDMAGANQYWNYHHNPNSGGIPAVTWPSGTTRYQAYQNELNAQYPWTSGSEPHAPHCSSSPTGDVTRRIISVAIVNCLANNVKGNTNTNLQSNMYAEFFIIKPAFYTNTILAEFIRMMTPQSDGTKLHQVVQLYR